MQRPSAPLTVVERVEQVFGRLDVLVNNAGMIMRRGIAAQVARRAAAARQPGPRAMVRVADAIGAEATGHRLCSAMRLDAAAMAVQRFYSCDLIAYPLKLGHCGSW